MNRTKILLMILCTVVASTLVMPAMAAENLAAGKTKEVSADYINPIYSQQVIDVTNDNVLPGKFRTTKDAIDEETAKGVDLTGLSDLNMSGSKTPSKNALKLIKEKTAGYDLYDVDLRKESHGMVDGMVVSWFGERDDANKELSEEQVITDEKNRLKKIADAGSAEFEVLPKGKSVDLTEVKNITKVQTEEETAKELGIGYIRIQVADHFKPEAKQIEQFVSFVNGLSDKAWLHFHCRGGAGRTTTFMCMYDMMKNAKKVSFDDIVKRQAIIGGKDLLEGNAEDKANPEDTRAIALRKFYDYCHDNNDNFKTTYSEYESTKVKSADTSTNESKKNKWRQDGDRWYYADESGTEVKNSWKSIDSKWYHFNESGVMTTGWFKDSDSNWYFLKSNGEMAHSEYIDGYWLSENGQWA